MESTGRSAGSSLGDSSPLAATLSRLLEKAGDYVERYEEQLGDVVAEEESLQQWEHAVNPGCIGCAARGAQQPNPLGQTNRPTDTESRSLRAEVVFTALPGTVPWASFRDVLARDGVRVRERGRLEPLFSQSRSTALRQAAKVSSESALFNLGPSRTPSVPTVALAYLHPEVARQVAFDRKGTATVAGVPAIEVAFRETGSPALLRSESGVDLPAAGRLWLREQDGAVLRSECEWREAGTLLTVSTEYGEDPAVHALVPVTMTESYAKNSDASRVTIRSRAGAPQATHEPLQERITTTSRYSGFHRLQPAPPSAAVSGSSTPAGRGKP